MSGCTHGCGYDSYDMISNPSWRSNYETPVTSPANHPSVLTFFLQNAARCHALASARAGAQLHGHDDSLVHGAWQHKSNPQRLPIPGLDLILFCCKNKDVT